LQIASGILDLAEGNLFINWKKIVGDEIAQHAQPISILDNVLTIQSSSTAWATQLQFNRS